MKNYIWVTFEKEGFHCYPEAATDPKLSDVKFLSHLHRHLFKFRVYIEVFSDNRDLEFFQFKRFLESLYADKFLELDFKSCEMIGNDLYSKIISKYPGRGVIIEVSEDGENGARLEFI